MGIRMGGAGLAKYANGSESQDIRLCLDRAPRFDARGLTAKVETFFSESGHSAFSPPGLLM